MAKWNGRIIFLDGFAGPGRYAGGEEGSPLIALRALFLHPHDVDEPAPLVLLSLPLGHVVPDADHHGGAAPIRHTEAAQLDRPFLPLRGPPGVHLGSRVLDELRGLGGRRRLENVEPEIAEMLGAVGARAQLGSREHPVNTSRDVTRDSGASAPSGVG
jgi:hypothetical protein